METVKKPGRARKVAPVAESAVESRVSPEESGIGRDGSESDRGTGVVAQKTWAEITARLHEIEQPNKSICAVFIPNPPRAVWMGFYGGAKLYEGDGYAVLQTGEKVRL